MTVKLKVKDCKKLDDCHKIKMILDKDLLDFQYQDAIRAVCAKCIELKKGRSSLDEGRIMIKLVIRFQNSMVVVFDKGGEQIPKYQGQYEAVKESILKNAPSEAIFAHGFTDSGELRKVPREEW